MKKKILWLSLIMIWILVVFLFWYILSPVTFYQTFFSYPKIIKIVTNITKTKLPTSITATTSEDIFSNEGFLTIKNDIWIVEIANTDQARINGLSNRATLNHKKGMLFVFKTSSRQSFWMKDMLLPIDIIFFDENWEIVLIERRVEPSTFPTIFGNEVESKYVLEINAGEADIFDLKLGDKAIFVNK